jgi:hypothetical protein
MSLRETWMEQEIKMIAGKVLPASEMQLQALIDEKTIIFSL